MRLETAVAGAVSVAQERTYVPMMVTNIAALFGVGSKGRSALAAQLAGTPDRKSNAYKAALRNVERYVKAESGVPGETRVPSSKTRDKLQEIAQGKINERTLEGMRAKGVTVSFSGAVIVSPTGRRPDERDRDIDDVYLDPEHVAAFLDALEEKRASTAADEFNAAFMDAYGVGGAVISDVYSLELTVGGGD